TGLERRVSSVKLAFIRRRLPILNLWSRLSNRSHRLGRQGERAATRFLRRRNHRIIIRNYRCSVGEIDIISADGDTIVFVEVKTRSSDEREDLWEAARPRKWFRVERAARNFLQQSSGMGHPCRFDLITVVCPARGPLRIEHVEDAYQPRSG
ncbi:MAG: YraN family protein, partial [Planctomycetes bacterium]|nr:YraN family protein [Planctomycetota bacterium]